MAQQQYAHNALAHASEEMFTRIGAYARGELNLVAQDYMLLKDINQATAMRYGEMCVSAKTILEFMETLDEKHKELQPILDQIEQIDSGISALEHAVTLLDAYTKRLEAGFKRIDKSQLLLNNDNSNNNNNSNSNNSNNNNDNTEGTTK